MEDEAFRTRCIELTRQIAKVIDVQSEELNRILPCVLAYWMRQHKEPLKYFEELVTDTMLAYKEQVNDGSSQGILDKLKVN